MESEISGKLYIGQTNDLIDRLRSHNAGMNLSTKANLPWKLLYSLGFSTRSEAFQLEKKLKGFKNPAKVKEWINYHTHS